MDGIVAEATRQAVAMLQKADPKADREARAGLLALLGEGPGALPAGEARAYLRLVRRRGAVMSPKAAAAALGVSRATLYRWESEGRIGRLRRGRIGPGKVVLDAGEVLAAAEQLRMARKRRGFNAGAQRRRGSGSGA